VEAARGMLELEDARAEAEGEPLPRPAVAD
jgi:hypothetical protein